MQEGKPEGPSYSFYPDGTTKAVGSYQQGLLSGEWTRYYPDGSKRDHGNWRSGLPHGDWQFWNPDGTLHNEDQYDAGVVLPKVIHFFNVIVLGGLNTFFGSYNNYTGYSGCPPGGLPAGPPGTNQYCYNSGPTVSNTSSVSLNSLSPGAGLLFQYHLWRKWIIEVGAVYKVYQNSAVTIFTDPVKDSYSQTQISTQPLMSFPLMWRYLFGEHLSLGLGFELKAYFPLSTQVSVAPVSGNPALLNNFYSGNRGNMGDGFSPVIGLAYTTQIFNQLGLVLDFRMTTNDMQLNAGASYPIF
jgi:hypothetical protein